MSIPTTQKALYLQSAKGSWAVGPNDVPTPSANEVLIRVEAATLNPVDWKIHDFDFGVPGYPAIIGTDSAGVVVRVGEDVTRFKVGDRVLHQGVRNSRQAIFQQYTVADEGYVAKIPPHISFDGAATLPLAVATAAIGLYAPKDLTGAALTAPWSDGIVYANEPILIIGGSSGVGQAVIQLAALSGFNPIITTVSPRNNDLVKSLGATHVIDRSQPLSTLADTVRSITSKPVKVAYDAISEADTQNAAYSVLAEGGSLIIVLPVAVKEADRVQGKEIVHVWGSAPHRGQFGKDLYKHFEEYLEKGDIKPNQPEVLPGGLAAIPDGLDRLRKNQVSGTKLIVHPQETA